MKLKNHINKFKDKLPKTKVQCKLIGRIIFNSCESIINWIYKITTALLPAIVVNYISGDSVFMFILLMGGILRILYNVFNQYKLKYIWFRIKTVWNLPKR